MAQKFMTLLLCTGVIAFSLLPVNAEDHKYKIYDPQTNKSYTNAILQTIPKDMDTYYIGLNEGDITCIPDNGSSTNANNLVGGACIGIDSHKGHMYSWRELEENTYLPEMLSIVSLFKEQGLSWRPVAVKQQETQSQRQNYSQQRSRNSNKPVGLRSGLSNFAGY